MKENLSINKNNIEELIRHYDDILVERPDWLEGYFSRGFFYYVIGEYDKSLKDYDRVRELKPRTSTPIASAESSSTGWAGRMKALRKQTSPPRLLPISAAVTCDVP